MQNVSEVTKGAPQAVIDILHGLESRDMDLMLRGFAPDAQWTVVGNPPRFPLGGTKAVQDVAEMLRVALPAMHAFEFELAAWAQNGDFVFAEAYTRAAGPGKAIYNNSYLMRFKLRDNLVVNVLEHYDPFEALDYLEQVTAGA